MDRQGDGLDKPDPLIIDYWMAIRLALEERMTVTDYYHSTTDPEHYTLSVITPKLIPSYGYRNVSFDDTRCNNIARIIQALSQYFLDPDNRQSWADFPDTLAEARATFYQTSQGYGIQKQWHSVYISNRQGCNFRNIPVKGAAVVDFIDWLKACKAAIDLMTLFKPSYVPCEHYGWRSHNAGYYYDNSGNMQYYTQEQQHTRIQQQGDIYKSASVDNQSTTWSEYVVWGDTWNGSFFDSDEVV